MADAAERSLAAAVLVTLVLVALPASSLEVGAGDRARSALHRVGVVEPGESGTLSVASDLSAGVTESLADTDAAHARFAARAAAAIDATRWLNLGAWVGGRYDRHPSDDHGLDDGFLLQPELSARLGSRSGTLGYGFEMAAWLPAGDDVGASFSGLSGWPAAAQRAGFRTAGRWLRRLPARSQCARGWRHDAFAFR
jgi:hypothetical protein